MSALVSLHINLHLEEEVDYLLRNLPDLRYLNGLPVEREAIFSGSEEEDRLSEGALTSGHQNVTINAQMAMHIPEDYPIELSSSRLTGRGPEMTTMQDAEETMPEGTLQLGNSMLVSLRPASQTGSV